MAPATVPRSLTILGSTGSIGRQALDVVRSLPGTLCVEALAAGASVELLIEQAREFSPRWLCVASAEDAREVRLAVEDATVLSGEEGLRRLAADAPADIVVVATVGWTGLEPTLAAIRAGRDIALANKEVLVCGGELVMGEAARAGVRILPIDSEHSAIAQCLLAGQRPEVRRLILTCSGGPFRDATASEIASAGPERTLLHPTWDMGRKVTVDSATLMNKGFEVIEGHHLFGFPLDRIDVIIHPQSIIHSMVEFVDGSILAQLGPTDMRFPIQYALTWPARLASAMAPLDLAAVGTLSFFRPDHGRFPCLRMAYEAARQGGSVPCILNAANEVAVAAHLAGEIACGEIPRVIAGAIDRHRRIDAPTLEQLRAADAEGRAAAGEMVKAMSLGGRVRLTGAPG